MSETIVVYDPASNRGQEYHLDQLKKWPPFGLVRGKKGTILLGPPITETLYRLPDGRWALQSLSTPLYADCQIIPADQARDWLERAGHPLPAQEDRTPPPLTELEAAVLGVIPEWPNAILGKEICKRTGTEQSTLTRHIIPKLKKAHGVLNRRGAGYYRPQQSPTQ